MRAMGKPGQESKQLVVLTTCDNQTYRGTLVSKNETVGKLVLSNVFVNGARLSGTQNFYVSSIKELAFESTENGLKEFDHTTNTNGKKGVQAPLCHKKDVPRHIQHLSRFDSDQLIRGPCHCGNEKDNDDQGIGSSEETESFEDFYETDEFVMFCRTCDKFRDSISYLMKQEVLAVSFCGVNLSREGTLSLLQVATEKEVILYDIIRLGTEGFVDGLQALLESDQAMKIIHDCRMISDLLFHQYDVTLSNVFDTQVASVFVFRLINGGDWPRFVDSLPALLMSHLGLQNKDVHHFFVRERLRQSDEEVWLQRPLCNRLLVDSQKNLRHMIPLYHALHTKMMLEFNIGVQMYLNHARGAPRDMADNFRTTGHLLPFVFQDLSRMASSSAKENLTRYRPSHKASYDSNGFVEGCSIRVDRMVLTSKDGIWQKKKLFLHANQCDSKDKNTEGVSPVGTADSTDINLPVAARRDWRTLGDKSDPVNRGMCQEQKDFGPICSKALNQKSTAPLVSTATSSCHPEFTEPSLSSIPSELDRLSIENMSISYDTASTPSQLDRLSMANLSDDKEKISPAVQRSALMRLVPSSPCYSSSCSSSSGVMSDSEIVYLREGSFPSIPSDWDVDKVLEFELSKKILQQARRVSKSDAKKRLLPSKIKVSPKPTG